MRKKILLILSVLLLSIGLYKITTKVTIIELPKGELKWSKTRPSQVKLCVPAAFSSSRMAVVGEYRIDGKSYAKNTKQKISIADNTFIIDESWKSNTGFQQIVLVKNGKLEQLKPSIKKCIRRALCKNKDKTFIIESNYPMTMTTFAYCCSKHCSDAVYLDMGEYGYGYIKNGVFTQPLYLIAYARKHKQTNWLYVQ